MAGGLIDSSSSSFNNSEKNSLECIVRRHSPQGHIYNALPVPKLTMHAVACVAKEFTYLFWTAQCRHGDNSRSLQGLRLALCLRNASSPN